MLATGNSRNSSARRRIAIGAVFALALALRLGVALTNTEDNDDHMEVAALIADQGANPLVDDCWQCCQAKLFHRSVAAVINAFSIADPMARVKTAQLLNTAAGALTLWLLWSMSGALSSSFPLRLTSFALVALNPKLVGINAQATNDSFVILFGTASIYALWRYLESSSLASLAATAAALILASVSKTQGLVLFAMTATILLARLLSSDASPARRRVLALGLTGLTVVYLGTVPFLGPYYDHYRLKGSPFAWNTPAA